MTGTPVSRRGATRVRGGLIALLVGMLVALLVVDGITTRTVGASSTGPRTTTASPLAHAGPILGFGPHGLVSRSVAPGRRIALTFDDGPSPQYTPRIARILLRAHVPATFFEVGSQVVRNPGITRMLTRDGFQVANHTFTHADLATLPPWQRNLQVSLDESAISGVTGRLPRLVRPPYSSTADATSPVEDQAWNGVAGHGYAIVLSNYDTEDWTQPGVATIVANGTPPGRQGGIVLMHDAGGRREQTVRALPQLIRRLRARGFRFVPVTALAGPQARQAFLVAGAGQRLHGRLLVAMLTVAGVVTNVLTWLVLAITVLAALRMAGALGLAHVQVRRARGLPTDLSHTPGVSIVVPAHNEAVGIERAVRSLAASRYAGPFEVIVVDDGSTDGTADLVTAADLPGVVVLRQANAGKPAALNRGLRAAQHDIIVTVDADTLFEPDTLVHLVQRFRDPRVGAISGNTKVGRRANLIERWQHIEYVMGFNLDRRMYEVLGCTPTVPGAIGAFRRQALVDVGGVSGATLAEDTDLTLDVGRAGWEVVYEPRARAWTEVPAGLRALYRQRSRWAYGTFQSLWKHRRAWRHPDQRRIGRRALPYMLVFQVLLPLAAPLIDLFAIYGLLFLDPVPIAAFWLAFNAFQFVLAWSAFGWDGEPRRQLWALPLQQVLYRQLMYLVVVDAVISALMGSRLTWNPMQRTGQVDVRETARP